ncbi:hypothetical protein FBZ83_102128 [Azospirillum brasilense]|uniref:Uncharacterized protein n=1 Tax=Azospirillum brasilense TaxID=192 RepID=A0A560CNC1_AZOBR|nr:hypothetical protein [Azospirillum brasilense]TWA86337.1 hypothetical protein FBZ83_102128 [Azospirillum brasilense]
MILSTSSNRGRKPSTVKSKYLGDTIRAELSVRNITQKQLSEYLNCDERTLRAKLNGSQGFSSSDLAKIDVFFSFVNGYSRKIAYYGANICAPGRVLVCGFTGAETSLAILFINSALGISGASVTGMVTVIDRNDNKIYCHKCLFRGIINDGYIRSILLETENGNVISVGGYNACIERYALQSAIVMVENCNEKDINHIFSEVPLLTIIISDNFPSIPENYREFNTLTFRILKIGCLDSLLNLVDISLNADENDSKRIELASSVLRRAAYSAYYRESSNKISDTILSKAVSNSDLSSKLIELSLPFSLNTEDGSIQFIRKICKRFMSFEKICYDVMISILSSAIQIKNYYGIHVPEIEIMCEKTDALGNAEKIKAMDALLNRYLADAP